jgi:hypothetical protein
MKKEKPFIFCALTVASMSGPPAGPSIVYKVVVQYSKTKESVIIDKIVCLVAFNRLRDPLDWNNHMNMCVFCVETRESRRMEGKCF